jgi:hypothetical protein
MQGNTIVVGRKSPNSLYNEKIASFEDDEGLYDQKDAAGFIKLQVKQQRDPAVLCRAVPCCAVLCCAALLCAAMNLHALQFHHDAEWP